MVNQYAIIGGFLILVIIGLTVGLVLATKKPSPEEMLRELRGMPQNKHMAQQNMQNAIAHHRRLNATQPPRPPPVRLNMASVHTAAEPIPPVREQHNFNVRFGQSREPLRNMMASDNEGAHLSSAIWNRESLIRKHKVIS